MGTILVDKLEPVEKLVSLEGNLVEADCGESVKTTRMAFDNFKKNYLRTNASALAFYKTSQSIVEWSRSKRLLEIFETCPKPKLLVLGAESDFVSRPKSKYVSVTEIPKAGHFLLRDQPELTLAAVLRFSEASHRN